LKNYINKSKLDKNYRVGLIGKTLSTRRTVQCIGERYIGDFYVWKLKSTTVITVLICHLYAFYFDHYFFINT